MSHKYEWLLDLKPGDQVIVTSSGYAQGDYIDIVERITKTQIILKKYMNKFRRESGLLIKGDIWNRKRLEQATCEKIKTIKDRERKRYLINEIEKNIKIQALKILNKFSAC
jgi:bifunctional DNA-binding transcriptional regulator/antitoxin component of YhaV-PrlF toxin-antitoxin module